MVLLGDELRVNICHTGMCNGNNVVKGEMPNPCGERYPKFTEASQNTTVYVFIGQGSQEPSMGMGPYNSSPVVGKLPGQVLMLTSPLYMVFSPRDCQG
jgi:fatty acid synthase subunit alpha